MSTISDYVTYKTLALRFDTYGANTDYILEPRTDKGVRQVCIKLPLITFARFSALCGVVFDNKQTIGRIALESAISDAWDALTAQGHGDDLRAEHAAFLEKEGLEEVSHGDGFYSLRSKLPPQEVVQEAVKEQEETAQ